MKKHVLAAAALAALAVAPPAMAQDPAAGEKVFRMCMACHAVGEGAKNKIGPELNGIIGRQPGHMEGFQYSPAMVSFGEGKVWDEALLDQYLENPRTVVKGTKMAFGGLRRPEQRADVIAYLATFSQ
ncbi:cytochrome c family protein [Acuticoccus sediminis]|uniref:Cytochrome c family protein n=1 Tax=Acuticoccus sediminis TaxID=2184697 RepID=A0A8B2NQQ8_9HYPH|nr:cytochrome c family protein [Acuticoccus sediminis]RAH99333.1 cytochrome c family protein [Acuticoccus sediminis]